MSADPILLSDENPDGMTLEELLERVLGELAAKQEREPCRETALVMTALEQALMWQVRRGMRRGQIEVRLVVNPASFEGPLRRAQRALNGLNPRRT